MVAARALRAIAQGPVALFTAILNVLRQPRNWAGIYLLLELWRYLRFRRRVKRIEHVDPFQPMSLSLSRHQHFKYCAEMLHFEPAPAATIRGFFQLSTNDDLSVIPRDAVLRALRFFLSAREESATASANSRKFNKSVAYAVEVNGGVEVDKEIPFDEVAACAKAVLQDWEQRDPSLRTALRDEPEEALRSHENRINFSRIGACDLTAWFKPLPLRLLIWSVRLWCCHVQLRRAGFRRRLAGHGVVFWTRNGHEDEVAARAEAEESSGCCSVDSAPAPAPAQEQQPPLFVMHGLGFGCVPYISTALRAAKKQPQRTIVLPEWPNISFGIYRGRYPSARELGWTLHQHLRQIGFEDGTPAKVADAIAHSYGTGVLTFWMREVRALACPRCPVERRPPRSPFRLFRLFVCCVCFYACAVP